jgi:CHAT domain-containing protein/tetratricopeptide (TPR) repeat protein
VGVFAGSKTGTALQVDGPVQFSSSGVATVKKGSKTVTVKNSAVTTSTIVLEMEGKGTVAFWKRQRGQDISGKPQVPAPRHETRAAALEAYQRAQMSFMLSRNPRDLDAAVDAAYQAIDLSADAPEKRAGWQGMAAVALLGRSEADGNDPGDLDECIKLARVATSSGFGDLAMRVQWLTTLEMALAKRFRIGNDKQDLADAVSVGREALDAVSETDQSFSLAASDLSLVLVAKFDATQDTGALAEAIELGRKAVAHVPAELQIAPLFQARLDEALGKRESYLQVASAQVLLGYNAAASDPQVSPLDIDRVIDGARATMLLLETQDLRRGLILSELGDLLLRRYQRTGAKEDLDEAIAVDREWITLLPVDLAFRLMLFDSFRQMLAQRFAAAPDAAARQGVIAIARTVAERISPNDPVYAPSRMQLAQLIAEDARVGGDRSAIAEAVEAAEAAVNSDQLVGVQKAQAMAIFAGALWARAEFLGSVQDLDRAIEQVRSAISLDRTAMNLGFLGSLLATRASLTGSEHDLDAAIESFESAIDAYGYTGAAAESLPAGMPADLCNLGLALLKRYERTGAVADLNSSVERGRQAVQTGGESHFEQIGFLGSLAYSLARRYDRLGDRQDLDEAIELFDRAVDSIDPSITGLDFLRGNLASALLMRGGRDDIDKAIELIRAELGKKITAEATANTLRNLCQALTQRFELDPALQDANDAIKAGQKAVELAPDASPSLAGALSCLGLAYRARYHSALRLPEDAAAAISAFRRASSIAGASPQQRAQDAMRWGVMAMGTSDYADAVEGFSTSIAMLGQVVPRRLERADQEHQLAGFTGIGSLAAACCLEMGDTARAVELWEHGRGILQAQQLDTRSDLTQLSAAHPDLAARFSDLAAELDRLGDGGAVLQAPGDQGRPATGEQPGISRAPTRDELRAELARSLSDCVEQIRAQAGFDRFLDAPSVQTLRGSTEGGPVVLLNVTQLRADAIVMRDGAESVVRLPGLTPSVVEDKVRGFLVAVATATNRKANEAEIKDAAAVVTNTLQWLYDAIAEPVLASLGLTAALADDEAWPRIWWCPSGLLSLLPLHAAGYHLPNQSGVPRSVIDRAVSSYTPTLRSLLRAMHPAQDGAKAPQAAVSQLVVSMPQTPGEANLPGAEKEARIVKSKSTGPIDELVGPQATHDEVLAMLDSHARAHFACHASSNLNNPSASYLLMSDYQTKPLTVLDVARRRLNGDLAVLSACSTARPGARLVDEVIHLTSGFQLAGYRHVVATMWPLADQLAVAFAEQMYSGLVQSGTFTADLSALATHWATRSIRAGYPDRPLLWAPFLHVGP